MDNEKVIHDALLYRWVAVCDKDTCNMCREFNGQVLTGAEWKARYVGVI